MTNRLIDLQDELTPPEAEPVEPEDEEEEEEDANGGTGFSAARGVRPRSRRRRVARTSTARALAAAPLPRPRRAPRAAARALAASRPIRYRVPGTVPLASAPGAMNTWAAAVAALLGWRERQVMGVEDAVGRLGSRWVDLLHRNQGLPAAEKAAFLAAAGLVADPPVRYEPDDLELLLRENGPLWVTDDDRGARLFSPKAYVITGIRASGGRDAQLEVIDAGTGRGGAMKLSRLLRRFGGGRGRLQVLHMGQGAPNGGAANGNMAPPAMAPSPLPPEQPVMQQALWSSAMNPAVAGPIIAATGLTWQVVKDLFNPTPDITITRARLNGKKHPGDDASWDARGTWQRTEVDVKRGRNENLAGDQQSVDFKVDFQHNGHSLGNILIHTLNPNDAFGWKLSVEQDIVIRDDLSRGGENPCVAAEVSFNYRHSAPIRNDVIRRARLIIHADGRWEQETLPEGQSLAEGMNNPPAAPSAAGPIIAATGLTWQVVKDLFNPTPDITITRARLNGKKHPGDDASWDARGTWQRTEVDVKRGRNENLAGDQQSVDFKVDFQHNGHSLGNILIHTLNPNDAFGWKLSVEQDIVIRDDLSRGGENPCVAAEVSFNYRHSAPIRNDVIRRARLIIHADGRWEQETLPEGQSLAEGMSAGRG